MRATKDSGVEWMQGIPESWKMVRMPYAASVVSRDYQDEFELLSVYLNRGVIPYSEGGGLVHKPSEDLSKYQHVVPGDIVLNNQQAWRGSVGVSRHFGNVSPAYIVLRPIPDWHQGYLNYLLRSPFIVTQLEVASRGVGDIQRQVSRPWMRDVVFPLPPADEQRRIAGFLDRETAKIDTLIAKQDQLITTLHERRQALISGSISLGSNSAGNLVASGNDQIGDIPRHWVLKRLRHLARLQGGADYKDFEAVEDGYPVYGSGGVFARATKYMYDGESVLFGRKGTIDRPLYVNGAFWTVDTMYWTQFHGDANPKFVYYWSTTLPFGLFTTATALPSMTASDIKNFFIAVPPREEQDEIVERLEEAIFSLDGLVGRTVKAVKLLQERRQALISAGVTGKIEVPV
jgi:type I restriction enzyme S subunit